MMTGQIGAPLLDLPQQRKSVHAGHVDVRENDDQLRLDAGELVQRILTGTREMQHVLASLKALQCGLWQSVVDSRRRNIQLNLHVRG